MHKEHKKMVGGMDSDNHQQGIERVKMRAGMLETGHSGKMGLDHSSPHKHAHQHKAHHHKDFKR